MMRFLFFLSCAYIIILNVIIFISAFAKIKYKKKKMIRILIIEALAIGVISYCIEPGIDLDLFRYYEIIDFFKTHDFSDRFLFIGVAYNSVTGTIFDIWLYLFAVIGNKYLFPFVSVTLYYSICFSIMLNSVTGSSISSYQLFFVKLINFAFTFLCFNIANPRFGLAVAILSWAMQSEFQNRVKKRFYVILLYVLAVLIHFSIIPLILIKLLYPIYQNKNIFLAIFLMIWSMSGTLVGNIMTRIPNNFIQSMGYKLRYYITNLSNAWDLSLTVGMFLIVLYLLILAYKGQCKISKGDKYSRVCLYFIFFLVGSLASRQFFARYIYFLSLFGLTYIMSVLHIKNSYTIRVNTIHATLISFMVILLAILQIRIIAIIYLPSIGWNI